MSEAPNRTLEKYVSVVLICLAVVCFFYFESGDLGWLALLLIAIWILYQINPSIKITYAPIEIKKGAIE